MNDFYKQGWENTSCNLLIKIAVALIAIVFLFSPLLAGRKASLLKLLVLVIVVICFPWVGIPLLVWGLMM